MDSNSYDSSSLIDSIRRADVGRRGGVRVRGGRLPPIRIRDTALQPAATKKLIAPKIPPRRIKREESPSTYGGTSDNQRSCERVDSLQKSARGRGRGPKVYLQSEGTFLGEGPAFKLKKEVQTVSYERGSKGGSRTKMEDTKFDPVDLKYLLGDYSEDESYFEEKGLMMPVRFPIIKKEIKQDIKTEMNHEIKQEIKEELLEIDGIKRIIKKEPFESLEEERDMEENKVVDLLKKVDISQIESSGPLEDLKFLKEEEVLLYLQLPSSLPFKKANRSIGIDMPSKDTEKTKQESEMTTDVTFKDLQEGHIGKLQIFRSGKMRMVFGSVQMAVEGVLELPTVCDAICISTENEDEGDAVIIGNVDQKMVLRPLFTDVQS